jgi:hypothetical protein
MAIKKPNSAVSYGLIAAGCMILFTFVLYRGGIDLYISKIAYLGYVISIGLAAMATLAQKKANGGWLEFRAALRTAFTVLVITLAAQTLFTWVLLNFIDPHFSEILTRAVLVNDAQAMKRFGISDDEAARTIAVERGKNLFSLGAMSLSLASVCIVHFIIALLIAAIIKKKKNE